MCDSRSHCYCEREFLNASLFNVQALKVSLESFAASSCASLILREVFFLYNFRETLLHLMTYVRHKTVTKCYLNTNENNPRLLILQSAPAGHGKGAKQFQYGHIIAVFSSAGLSHIYSHSCLCFSDWPWLITSSAGCLPDIFAAIYDVLFISLYCLY